MTEKQVDFNRKMIEVRIDARFSIGKCLIVIELNMLDMRGLPVNIDILLFGNDDLSVEINTFIFSCVRRFRSRVFHDLIVLGK
jgi:hypothetical protein